MTKIRLISGQFGGRLLDAPSFGSSRTKPMGERIRNALFNIIQGEVAGARVLDAFAGTGSLGLEALSRGASSVYFVERDKVAGNIITANITELGVQESTKLVKSSVSAWVDTYSGELFDLILADPPYNDLQFSTVSKLFGLLKPKGLMVLSHTGRGEGPNLLDGIVVVDNRSYGNARLTFFRRER